jgi:RNA polymerase sigma factor (sigma-70 family)
MESRSPFSCDRPFLWECIFLRCEIIIWVFDRLRQCYGNHLGMTPQEIKEVTEQHMGLVWSIAWKFDVPAPWDREDLVHEGYFGLLKAAERYDGRAAFSSFAHPWIRGSILRWFRDKNHVIRGSRNEPPIPVHSLDLTISDDGATLLELVAAPEPEPEPASILRPLSSLPWEALTPKQQEVLCLRAQGVTSRVIAKHLGTTEPYASRIYTRALARMKVALSRELEA